MNVLLILESLRLSFSFQKKTQIFSIIFASGDCADKNIPGIIFLHDTVVMKRVVVILKCFRYLENFCSSRISIYLFALVLPLTTGSVPRLVSVVLRD